MANRSDDFRELRTWCEQFENLWAESPPPDVKVYLETLPEHLEQHRKTALTNILTIDLQRRWTSKGHKRSTLNDYARDHDELGTPRDWPRALLAEEFRCEQHWGTKPTPQLYLHRYGLQDEPTLAEMLEKTAESVRRSAPEAPTDTITYNREAQTGNLTRDTWCPPNVTLLGLLGRGGMGLVYEAKESSLPRTVALKRLLGRVDETSPDAIRFRREAEALALLQHPNIVTLHSVGEHKNQLYLILEYCKGGSLDKVRTRLGRYPPREAATLTRTLAKAIQVAHSLNILHRDLKPANVLLVENTPKVTDFGLAKTVAPLATIVDDSDNPRATQAGTVMGTPSYMPPEQADGRTNLTPAADVYGLGAILFDLLTGQPPFVGDSVGEVLRKVRDEPAEFPEEAAKTVSLDLQAVCLKSLAKNPEERYETAEAFGADLQRFLDGYPVEARPKTVWVVIIKWMLRNPIVAALIWLVLGVSLVGSIVSLVYKERAEDRAEDAVHHSQLAKKAQGEAEEARDQEEDARKETDQINYGLRSGLALAALVRDNPRVARLLLDEQRPRSKRNTDHRNWEWHYLQRLCHSELATVTAHPGGVRTIARRPDGGLLATGGEDGLICLWSSGNFEKQRTLKGHQRPITGLVFSPDGSRLASCSGDLTARVWNVRTGSEVYISTGHLLPFRCLAFSPKGDWLAVAGDEGTVHLLDSRTGNRLQVWFAHREAVRQIEFTADGEKLISGGADGKLAIWDVRTGTLVRQFRAKSAGIVAFDYLPKSDMIAVVDAASKIFLWKLGPDKIERFYERPKRRIESVAFHPDGTYLVTAGLGRVIQVWDTQSGERVRTLKGHLDAVRDLEFSRSGKTLFSAGEDGTVKAWNPTRDQDCTTLRKHVLPVLALALSPDGRTLVTAGNDQLLEIWDTATGEVRKTIGERLVIREPGGMGNPKPIQEIRARGTHTNIVMGLSFSPDGKTIASAGCDETVRLWDAVTGQERGVLPHNAQVSCLAYSPKGDLLAAGTWSDSIVVWDIKSRTRLHTLHGHSHNLEALAFDPTGKMLVSVSRDRTAKLWDVTNGKEIRTFVGHKREVTGIAFDKEGKRIATSSQDQTLRIWDVATGNTIRVLLGHTASVEGIAFSPDGKRLASVGSIFDPTLKIWDAETGREILSLEGARKAVRFSNDGKLIVTAGLGAKVKLWDSRPLDNQAFRTAPHKEEVANNRQERPLPEKVDVLGRFVTSVLRFANDFGGTDLKVGKDHDFYCVVVSLPKRELVMTEQEHRHRVEKATREGTPLPASRESYLSIRANRFRLDSIQGKDVPADYVLFGPFPSAWNGGVTTAYETKSSDTHIPNQRVALLLVWALEKGRTLPRASLRLDDGEGVEVPLTPLLGFEIRPTPNEKPKRPEI